MFASTHLDAKTYSTNRLLQVKKLISIFSDTESKIPVIVAGDFNTVPNSVEIHTMKEHFFDISENLGNTIPSDVPNRKIDYLFILSKFRNSYKLIEGQVIPEAIASDHRPVFVDLELEK
jgi:endonuclease/exonuclease/phosphatase family metal-dependent hydrolase